MVGGGTMSTEQPPPGKTLGVLPNVLAAAKRRVAMGSPYLEHDIEMLKAAGEAVPAGGTIICSDPEHHKHDDDWLKPGGAR